jgi:hypothetical protein
MPHEWEHLIDVEEILSSYIEAGLWATHDESTPNGGEPLDANYSAADIAPETLEQMRADIIEFLDRVGVDDIESYLTGRRFTQGIGNRHIESGEEFVPQTAQQMGHDFFLTREGHGVGFWDRGLGDLGEDLSEICREMGECNLYVGDDGKIYQ